MAQGARRQGRDRLPDHEFRRLASDARARVRLSSIVGRKTKLKKTGHEFTGLCPFHSERTPSFTVNDAAEFFHCFGCGAHGDHFDFLMRTMGYGWREAYRALTNGDLPQWSAEERTKAREHDLAERLEKAAEVRQIVARSIPATGTIAQTYARSRGIYAPLPDTIRFAETYAWRKRDTGEVGPDRPAVICVCESSEGIMGIQRIFIKPDGSGKADMPSAKLSLGNVRGVAHRLGPAAENIIICEGPEDGWSLMQELPDRTVWVGLGTSMLPEIDFPPIVRSITIAGQNDRAGRVATAKTQVKLVGRGFGVSMMFPDEAYADWNDQLRDRRR